MSERERWIVYPLLFLALGAAIRDKLFHHVSTGGIRAEEVRAEDVRADTIAAVELRANALRTGAVICESVTVVDPKNPSHTLARLAAATENSPNGQAERYFGALILTDSQSHELFGVADDRLVMRQIQCEGIQIVDPEQPGRVLYELPPRQPVPQ